jgi:hypothetical protein
VTGVRVLASGSDGVRSLASNVKRQAPA